jgi:hypothetical protein
MMRTTEGGGLVAVVLATAKFVALEIGHRLGFGTLARNPDPPRETPPSRVLS